MNTPGTGFIRLDYRQRERPLDKHHGRWALGHQDSCLFVELGRHSLQWRHNGRNGVSDYQPHDFCLTVYSGADQRKHQSTASLALVRGIHRWRKNSPQKGPVTLTMFPFDDVIMTGKFIIVIRVLTGNLFNHAPGNVISKGAIHLYLHPLKHNASNRWLSERLQYLQCNGDATVFH